MDMPAVGVPPKNPFGFFICSSHSRISFHCSPSLSKIARREKTAPETAASSGLFKRLMARISWCPFSARSPHARTSTSLLSAPAAAAKISSGTAEAFGFWAADSLAGFLEELSQPTMQADTQTSPIRIAVRKKTPSLEARKSEHDFNNAACFLVAGNLHNLRNVRAG